MRASSAVRSAYTRTIPASCDKTPLSARLGRAGEEMRFSPAHVVGGCDVGQRRRGVHGPLATALVTPLPGRPAKARLGGRGVGRVGELAQQSARWQAHSVLTARP